MASDRSNQVGASRNNGAGCSGTRIRIKIKTMDQQTYDLEVNKHVPVPELKQQIAPEVWVDPQEQRLLFRGRVLKDDELLSSHRILLNLYAEVSYYMQFNSDVEEGHNLYLVEIPVRSSSSLVNISRRPVRTSSDTSYNSDVTANTLPDGTANNAQAATSRNPFLLFWFIYRNLQSFVSSTQDATANPTLSGTAPNTQVARREALLLSLYLCRDLLRSGPSSQAQDSNTGSSSTLGDNPPSSVSPVPQGASVPQYRGRVLKVAKRHLAEDSDIGTSSTAGDIPACSVTPMPQQIYVPPRPKRFIKKFVERRPVRFLKAPNSVVGTPSVPGDGPPSTPSAKRQKRE